MKCEEVRDEMIAYVKGEFDDERRKEIARSHEQASRCKRCGFRDVCDQKVV